MAFMRHFRTLNKCLIKYKIINRFQSNYSYAFEPSLEPLSVLTIGQLIEDCAQDSGDKTAIVSVHQNMSKTYEELNSDVMFESKDLGLNFVFIYYIIIYLGK